MDAVRRACRYLERYVDEPGTMVQLAGYVGLSPSHLQRMFSQAVGVSPCAYQKALRARRFRRDPRCGEDVSSAVYGAGWGSVSRVCDRHPTGVV